ncbi:hypothetical protein EV183_002442 [Coemansia sp. RSA 2336]|nr:hypothetical protein EV183_002442 [Coemansia sp. RSA 2336]
MNFANIFLHRIYSVAHSQAAASGQSTPNRQSSGFLSPSSVSLVTSPLSPTPAPRTPGKPADLWTSPTKPKKKSKDASQGSLQDALASMKKAQRLATKDPAVAATVLWKVSKDVAQYPKQKSNLESALSTTQRCLHAMVDRPELRGGKESGSLWSARSLLKTTLECDFAIARLLWLDNKQQAARNYMDALARYLGIESKTFDELKTCSLESKDRMAQEVVAGLPRKFSKQEDISQALDALEEAASAQLAARDSECGLVLHLLRHAFAQKKQPDIAYQTMASLISMLQRMDLDYMANACAVLIIKYHMNEPDAHMRIAQAVTSSIEDADLVQARYLLEKYHSQFTEPWSQFIDMFVSKLIVADVEWMCNCARTEWSQVYQDHAIYKLIDAAVTKQLGDFCIQEI